MPRFLYSPKILPRPMIFQGSFIPLFSGSVCGCIIINSPCFIDKSSCASNRVRSPSFSTLLPQITNVVTLFWNEERMAVIKWNCGCFANELFSQRPVCQRPKLIPQPPKLLRQNATGQFANIKIFRTYTRARQKCCPIAWG